jgi:hypothetical protein
MIRTRLVGILMCVLTLLAISTVQARATALAPCCTECGPRLEACEEGCESQCSSPECLDVCTDDCEDLDNSCWGWCISGGGCEEYESWMFWCWYYPDPQNEAIWRVQNCFIWE